MERFLGTFRKAKDNPKPYVFPAKSVNDLARLKFKEQILKEILFDLTVCEIEGWDKKESDKEYIKLSKKMQSFRPTDVCWFEAKTKLDNYISEKIESYYKLVNMDRVAFADLMSEMTPEEVQDCKFKSNMIIRLADMIECYSLEIEDILENCMLDAKIMLFDKIRDAGKGAKEVIDYLGTTTGDFQMDIAETNDELRVKVESLVKMIKR